MRGSQCLLQTMTKPVKMQATRMSTQTAVFLGNIATKAREFHQSGCAGASPTNTGRRCCANMPNSPAPTHENCRNTVVTDPHEHQGCKHPVTPQTAPSRNACGRTWCLAEVRSSLMPAGTSTPGHLRLINGVPMNRPCGRLDPGDRTALNASIHADSFGRDGKPDAGEKLNIWKNGLASRTAVSGIFTQCSTPSCLGSRFMTIAWRH